MCHPEEVVIFCLLCVRSSRPNMQDASTPQTREDHLELGWLTTHMLIRFSHKHMNCAQVSFSEEGFRDPKVLSGALDLAVDPCLQTQLELFIA